MTRSNRWRSLATLFALLAAAACADRSDSPTAAARPAAQPLAATSPGNLLWFGYAGETNDAASLAGTTSYANWAQVLTNDNPSSTAATTWINQLAASNLKALVELGPLLWYFPTPTSPWTLRPDYVARFNTWKNANASVLNSTRVLGFLIGDGPHHNRMDIASWDAAAGLVKQTFPWAKILLIDGAGAVASSDPNSHWNRAPTIQNVDWVGLSIYAIHPATYPDYQTARQKMKARYPGKRWIYVADGFFNTINHTPVFGSTAGMGQAMQEWYDVAAADPDAILLGVFIWPTFAEGTGSRDFPPSALAVHTQVGRAITYRTRGTSYQPVGVLDSISSGGTVTGWACDPDAAWGETVLVDLYVDGALRATVPADKANPGLQVIAQCRSGNHRRFSTTLMAAPNQRITAVARDLNAGSSTLPWAQVAWVKPAYASWGTPNTLTVAGLAGSGTGGVQITWRDRTLNGAFTTVGWAPAPSPTDGSWSNTIPSSNYCHDYEVYARYAGFRTRTFTYSAATSGFCTNRLYWIQTAALAGFGPAGSLVVAGNLSGAPAGSGVQMYYRNVTLNGPWTPGTCVATTDANGTWYNHIPNANPGHQYAVYSRHDGGVQSPTCVYVANSGRSNC